MFFVFVFFCSSNSHVSITHLSYHKRVMEMTNFENISLNSLKKKKNTSFYARMKVQMCAMERRDFNLVAQHLKCCHGHSEMPE